MRRGGTKGSTIESEHLVDRDGQHCVFDLAVEMLPAEHGDSILIRAAVPKTPSFTDRAPGAHGEYRILIDVGPATASLQALKDRLRALRPGVGGERWIDLLVFTHLDADHIGNAVALLEDSELNLHFGDIWFNGYEQLNDSFLTKSYLQADSLSRILGASFSKTHNRAFGGGPVVVPYGQQWLRVPLGSADTDMSANLPVLTLLSPDLDGLATLRTSWDKWRGRYESDRPEDDAFLVDGGMAHLMLRKSADSDLDIDELAQVNFVRDSSPPNGSSIAFILEHGGRHVLLLGDAHADVVEPAYLGWRADGRADLQPAVIKLSHHGSARNTTADLAAFGATSYFISSSGHQFSHPDDVTLARLVSNALPGTKPTFWFNHRSPAAERWERLAQNSDRFDVKLPPTSADGIGVVLGQCTDEDRPSLLD